MPTLRGRFDLIVVDDYAGMDRKDTHDHDAIAWQTWSEVQSSVAFRTWFAFEEFKFLAKFARQRPKKFSMLGLQ
jgi:hypothetical protein